MGLGPGLPRTPVVAPARSDSRLPVKADPVWRLL